MTTVLAVRRENDVVIISDGQVTLGNTVMKHSANKLRSIADGKIIAGFAGSTADAFALFERFEAKLSDYSYNLLRAAVELSKEWRTDKMLQKLEALLLVADHEQTLVISGTGDIVSPESGAAAIGSGGNFAQSAAIAMLNETELGAEEIGLKAMKIAADLCIYSNHHTNVLKLNNK